MDHSTAYRIEQHLAALNNNLDRAIDLLELILETREMHRARRRKRQRLSASGPSSDK